MLLDFLGVLIPDETDSGDDAVSTGASHHHPDPRPRRPLPAPRRSPLPTYLGLAEVGAFDDVELAALLGGRS